MKLGIIVVYLFDENTEYLLDLHIKYIRKFTDVPYNIYGGIGRLDSKGRQKLSCYPEVQQHDLPPTDLRGCFEHAFYLDLLTEIAIQEGSTHIVTLHLDSFPVCLGWVRKLKDLTDQMDSCVALEYYYTACFFFSKEFYARFRPKFNGEATILKSSDYKKFMDEFKIINHSGSYFLFICYINDLGWFILEKSSAELSSKFGDIFGGLVFHLRSAVALSQDFEIAQGGDRSMIKFRRWIIDGLTFLGRHLSTYKMREWIRKKLPDSPLAVFDHWCVGQRELVAILEAQSDRVEMEFVKAKLIENAEAYLFELQHSSKAECSVIKRHKPFLAGSTDVRSIRE